MADREPLTDSWPDDVAAAYRQHLKALKRQAGQVCPDPSSAEDACHDVFVRILITPRSTESLGLSYMVVAVRNACRDHLRREKKWQPLDSGRPEPESTAPPDQDEDDRSLQLTRWRSLLPEQQQQAITLWAGGSSHQEIADALGVKVKTVRTHLNRGKATLRQRAERERGREREREHDS